MELELLDYQADAAHKVAKLLIRSTRDYAEDRSDLSAVVLAAPTGAGKTVVATAVVEASLDEDEVTPGVEGATFLWVTDDPSLNRQTVHKMMAASSALAPNRLITIENDFDEESLSSGNVYFLNIQKLSTSANLSKSRTDGRTWSFWETIENTVRLNPYGFIVVIDEAHRGMGSSTQGRSNHRDTIVAQLIGGGATNRVPVPVVWGISATPKKFVTAMAELGRTTRVHTVQLDDVRTSGLLKDQIVLGHTRGVDAAESTLVRHAVRRIRTYDNRWHRYTTRNSERTVNPALIIQVGDKPSTSEIEGLISTVFDEWPELRPHNVVHVFGDHSDLRLSSGAIAWSPPEDIQDRPGIRVVLCKTAITTGWDCPRAEVLLSLRVAKDLELITQVMGRMVRTPLARTIADDEDLNAVHCILPKFDETAVDSIADRFRAGDPDSLTGGTQVVTRPADIVRNPHFSNGVQKPNTQETDFVADYADDSSRPDALELVQSDAPSSATRDESDNSRSLSQSTRNSSRSDGQSDGVGERDLFDSPQADQELRSTPSKSIFDLFAALPSYTIPRRSFRSPVSRLTAMAFLLATEHDGRVIHHGASTEMRRQLLSVIDLRKESLKDSGQLEHLLEQARTTKLFERVIAFGQPETVSADSITRIPLDARGITILMNRAKASLPEGLANEYVKRLAPTDEDVVEAMLTVIAIATDPELKVDIEERASRLLEDWFGKFGSQISRLSPANRERFDRIKRESDRPILTSFSIPERRTEEAEGEWWPQHVLSDASGQYRALFLDWEAHVLSTELKAGVVAWYRNPRGGQHSLRIPYSSFDGVAGMSPDFIFVEEIAGNFVASIVDPHGTHLSDALAKLRGLSDYAASHGNAYHRIQSVAKIDGRYLALDHLDSQVREAVLDHPEPDPQKLFSGLGLQY